MAIRTGLTSGNLPCGNISRLFIVAPMVDLCWKTDFTSLLFPGRLFSLLEVETKTNFSSWNIPSQLRGTWPCETNNSHEAPVRVDWLLHSSWTRWTSTPHRKHLRVVEVPLDGSLWEFGSAMQKISQNIQIYFKYIHEWMNANVFDIWFGGGTCFELLKIWRLGLHLAGTGQTLTAARTAFALPPPGFRREKCWTLHPETLETRTLTGNPTLT